ncbi:hypothetical protein CAEBREN_28309 [Caenorhabditis brenneri]|uniref:RRM domain-containing protein n=1 Tax=Caenorhabditis brenneri TaxID=135651 RepID=G0PJF4_CAEBE|nr:hypothetical protein CAEBREN_28309 [Caenorhabditis brenneri]
MNGADIYSGCCTLKVEFAKPDRVRVVRQDKDQRDFTLPDSWFFLGPLFLALYHFNSFLMNWFPMIACLVDICRFEKQHANRYTRKPRDNQKNRNPNIISITVIAHSYEVPQDSGRKTLIPSRPDDHYYDRRPYEEERDPYDRRDYAPPPPPQPHYGYPPRGAGPPDYYNDRGPPLQSRYRDDYDDRGRMQPTGGGPGCVLMVYGIEHSKINCDMMFNILCQYGNVLRISFMRTKVETGMIEMGTPDERHNVLDFLQGFSIFGLKLEFKPSHQECVHFLRDPFLLPDGSPSFKDYTSSRNQRFTTPELASKNRIIFPTHVLHWFNAPGTMDENALLDLLAEKTEHKPLKIEVFPSRNERSAAGTAEFESVEIANEVLAKVNHTPVNSPYGSAPFIVKWAYATPRRWDGSGGEPPKYDEGGDGERREGYIQPAARPSPSFRRGRGDSGYRRDSYRGGLHGNGGHDRFAPYPGRGGGGFRGGRGRGRFNDY